MATVVDRPQQTRGPAQGGPPSPPRTGAPRGSAHVLARAFAVVGAGLAIAAVCLGIALAVGSGPAPPATGAATLVPGSALLYLDVSTDPSRATVRQSMFQVQRLSGAAQLSAAVTDRLDAILTGSHSGAVDFKTDVRPWLGPEAAFAVLNTPGASAGTLIVLDVRNRARANAFVTAQGALPEGSYRKARLLRESSGTTLAFLGHYLVFGQPASVRAAIDVAAGSAQSLAASSQYAAAMAGAPADRVLGLYAPAAGVRRALAPSQGLLGALGVLLDQPALSAASLTVSPAASGFAVRVHSLLDPKLASAPSAQTPAFTASLSAALPAGTTMMLDVRSLPRAVPKLLAAAAKLGIAARAAGLLARLGAALSSQGVNLKRFFSIFGSESALAIVPGIGGGPAPVLVGRTDHPAEALSELANLEVPLTQAFTPPNNGGGLVPEVAAVTLARTTVSELTLAPGFQLDWAVRHGLVVVSTSPGAVAAVISHRTSLGATRSYQAAVAGLPTQLTTLVFLDTGPLLRLGQQTGLIGGTTLTALLGDLEQIRAIALATTRGESDTTTQLQLQIR